MLSSPAKSLARRARRAGRKRGANLIEATILAGLTAILVLIAIRLLR